MEFSTIAFKLVLTGAVLVTCIYLVRLLFDHTRTPMPVAVRKVIVDAIIKGKMIEFADELHRLELREDDLQRKKSADETEKDIEEDAGEKAKLQREIRVADTELAELRKQISATQKDHILKANEYADSIVQDIDSESLRSAGIPSHPLFLEFMTVVFIISGILILAILEVLNGEQLAPILASVAGYVLGRTSSNQAKL